MRSGFALAQWTKGNWSWQLVNRSLTGVCLCARSALAIAITRQAREKNNTLCGNLYRIVKVDYAPTSHPHPNLVEKKEVDEQDRCMRQMSYFVCRQMRLCLNRGAVSVWHRPISTKKLIKSEAKIPFLVQPTKRKTKRGKNRLHCIRSPPELFCFVCWRMLKIKQLSRC